MVEEVDVRSYRHAVDDIQRVGAVDGRDTADDDTRSGTRATGTCHVHTIHLSLQGVHHVTGGEFLQFLTLNGRDAAGEVAFLGYTVTDDHNLVQVVGHIVHHYIDRGTAVYHLLNRVVANHREYKRGISVYLDAVVSVKVGHCSCARTFNLYRCANHRLIVGRRNHCAFHRDFLGMSH